MGTRSVNASNIARGSIVDAAEPSWPAQLRLALSLSMTMLALAAALALHQHQAMPLPEMTWASGWLYSQGILAVTLAGLCACCWGRHLMNRIESLRVAPADSIGAPREPGVMTCAFDAAPVAMSIGGLTPAAAILHANLAWANLVGIDPATALPRSLADVVQGDDLHALEQAFATVVANPGSSANVTVSLHLAGTRDLWVELLLSMLRVDGSASGLVVVQALDLSEQRNAELAKSEFIAVVSHELRTPLTAILSALGLLAGPLAAGLPEQGQRLLGSAQRNSRRMLGLINDILDIDKIAAGAMTLEREPLQLNELLGQALDDLVAYADRLDVKLELAPLPPACVVFADGHRLNQIIVNLISNAAKFSRAGGTVRLEVLNCDSQVEIAVIDQGEGIAPDKLGQIFGKFHQADSTIPRKKGGSGLGLFISEQLTRLMGGHIGVHSELGSGSRFWIRLPVAGPVMSTSE